MKFKSLIFMQTYKFLKLDTVFKIDKNLNSSQGLKQIRFIFSADFSYVFIYFVIHCSLNHPFNILQYFFSHFR